MKMNCAPGMPGPRPTARNQSGRASCHHPCFDGACSRWQEVAVTPGSHARSAGRPLPAISPQARPGSDCGRSGVCRARSRPGRRRSATWSPPPACRDGDRRPVHGDRLIRAPGRADLPARLSCPASVRSGAHLRADRQQRRAGRGLATRWRRCPQPGQDLRNPQLHSARQRAGLGTGHAGPGGSAEATVTFTAGRPGSTVVLGIAASRTPRPRPFKQPRPGRDHRQTLTPVPVPGSAWWRGGCRPSLSSIPSDSSRPGPPGRCGGGWPAGTGWSRSPPHVVAGGRWL
jgi:hypothetical protein